jgi:hypothetical protein
VTIVILVAGAAIVHLLASVDWPLGDRDRRRSAVLLRALIHRNTPVQR